MGGRAHLEDPNALFSLAEAIRQFEEAGHGAIAEATASIVDARERVRMCQEAWEAEVQRREVDLEFCQHDPDSDCTSEEHALDEAKRDLDIVQGQAHEVDQQIERYKSNLPRFRGMLSRCESARGYLIDKGGTAFQYVADPLGQARSGVSKSGATSPASSVPNSGQSARARINHAPVLARYHVRGDEFADVSLSQIEVPTFAPTEWSTTDVADMQLSFQQLPRVRQAIAEGTIDQLVASDASARRVYDWFYGGERIRLDWHQGQWTITNGKHRVEMARALGLQTLPAKVWTPK